MRVDAGMAHAAAEMVAALRIKCLLDVFRVMLSLLIMIMMVGQIPMTSGNFYLVIPSYSSGTSINVRVYINREPLTLGWWYICPQLPV